METAHWETVKADLDQLATPEEKLQVALDWLESALAQEGAPQWKLFWEARRFCLELFKGRLLPHVRAALWEKYTTLSDQGRRLRELQEEESAFSVEQVQTALEALQKEVDAFFEGRGSLSPFAFETRCSFLRGQLSEYASLQAQLQVLGSLASRWNSFRKELMGSEIRVKRKTQFFGTLSEMGDRIFPLRKELMEEVSALFVRDVDRFIQTNFPKKRVEGAPFPLKEEIKALQQFSKELTLDSSTFSNTRLRLSECWDLLKEKIAAHKAQREKRREESAKRAIEWKEQVDAYCERFASEGLCSEEGRRQMREFRSLCAGRDVDRRELGAVEEALKELQRVLVEKEEKEKSEREKKRLAEEKRQKERREQLSARIEQMLTESEGKELEAFEQEREALRQEIAAAGLGREEQRELQAQLSPLCDLFMERQERALAEDGSKERIGELLQRRRELCQEIKDKLRECRKSAGSSGLDFAEALARDAEIQREKERLAKAEEAVVWLEQLQRQQ